jgi:hypothetical protein
MHWIPRRGTSREIFMNEVDLVEFSQLGKLLIATCPTQSTANTFPNFPIT